MAISIDWGTKVISVPKADLTVVQLVPTEIYELNINTFRLELKDLEDSEEGMPHLDTHRHNTEVTLGGITYARTVEIINGYTVTFEDGQYAVNLVGANHNVGDVTNVNQVSVRVSNSAGLINSPAIEYASYNGGVTVDASSSYAGTLYPVGTLQQPVNNLEDALLIAEYRGFNTFYIHGSITVDNSNDYTGMIFIGESMTKTQLTVSANANVYQAEFYDCTLTGTLDGEALVEHSRIANLVYVNGIIQGCLLEDGTITLGGGADAFLLDCWCGSPTDSYPIIDMGGSGQSLSVRGYSGGIKLTNKSGADYCSITLQGGTVILDSTVTAGVISIAGNGDLTDNSVGATVDGGNLLNADNIQRESWEANVDWVYVDAVNGAAGTTYPLGRQHTPVDNMADAITIAQTYGASGFKIRGTTTLTATLSGYRVEGWSSALSDILQINSQVVEKCNLERVTLTGTFGTGTGNNQAIECFMSATVGFVGVCVECGIFNGLTMGDAGTTLLGTGIVFADVPYATINMVGASRALAMDAKSGTLVVTNMAAGSVFQIGQHAGSLTIDSSCTGGTVIAHGNIIVTNNAPAVTLVHTTTGDVVNDEVVEGSITLRQAMRLMLAVLTGKSSGGGSSSITFRDTQDSKDRIVATVDSNGNRTAVGTRDGS